MKKGKILLIMTIIFAAGILVGFFVARNVRSNVVLLSPAISVSDGSLSDLVDYGLDINTAKVSELMELPGIGETLAGRIVAFREENGKFHTVEDLLAVDGIGPKTLKEIENLIKVGD